MKQLFSTFLRRFSALSTAMLLLLQIGVVPAFAQEFQIRALDAEAGKPALIMMSGQPNQQVKLLISTPLKGAVQKSFQLNDEGGLQYWHQQTQVAGEYYLESSEGAFASFEVIPGAASSVESSIYVDRHTVFLGESVNGEVQLKDAYGNRLANSTVSIRTKQGEEVSCKRACKTDEDGKVYFDFQAKTTGLKEIQAFVSKKSSALLSQKIGVVPKVQNTNTSVQQYPSNYAGYQYPFNMGYQQVQPWYGNYQMVNPYQPLQATPLSQGNNDANWNGTANWMGAQLLNTQLLAQNTQQQQTTQQQGVQQDEVAGFEILFSDDEEADFEEEVAVRAQSALDFYVRAVDMDGDVIEDYDGEITFEIDPAGTLLPSDYQFSAADDGVVNFELALILSAGEYTLRVIDTDQPNVMGEVDITASLASNASLNNTDILLSIDSPTEGGKYSGTFSVQGSTSTENTQVIILEDGIQIAQQDVDEDKNFSIPIQLDDGQHELEIQALYLVDGSETSTTVQIEVDQSAPVVQKISSSSDSVAAGENFTLTVEADAGSNLQAFINNRAYDFEEQEDGVFTATIKAPLDEGSYSINIQAEDEFGNSISEQDVLSIEVTPAVVLEDIQNIVGIAGVGKITLIWDAYEGAESYLVTYKTALGLSESELEVEENRAVIDQLLEGTSYTATVVALDADGEALSLETESRAVRVLSSPTQEPVVTTTEPEEELRGAAEEPQVQTMPTQHSQSGPEVYLLILLSFVVLNIYGRIRKAWWEQEML